MFDLILLTKIIIKKTELIFPVQIAHVGMNILFNVLVCSIAKDFCELCRILTSLQGESKYKQCI